MSPGPEMSLYLHVIPGDQRCTVLNGYFQRKGHAWPGSDENAFVQEMSDSMKREMIEPGEVTKRGSDWSMGWSQVSLFAHSNNGPVTLETRQSLPLFF